MDDFERLTPSQSYELAKRYEEQQKREDYRTASIAVRIHNAHFKRKIKPEELFASLELDKKLKSYTETGNQMLSHMKLVVYNKPVNLREDKKAKNK